MMTEVVTMRMRTPFQYEPEKLLSMKFGWRLIPVWLFSETNAAAMRTREPAGLHRRAFADGTFARSFTMAAAEPGNRRRAGACPGCFLLP
jgi:hypothetical protein